MYTSCKMIGHFYRFKTNSMNVTALNTLELIQQDLVFKCLLHFDASRNALDYTCLLFHHYSCLSTTASFLVQHLYTKPAERAINIIYVFLGDSQIRL